MNPFQSYAFKSNPFQSYAFAGQEEGDPGALSASLTGVATCTGTLTGKAFISSNLTGTSTITAFGSYGGTVTFRRTMSMRAGSRAAGGL